MIDREAESPPPQPDPVVGVVYWMTDPCGRRHARDPFRLARVLARELRGRNPLDALDDYTRYHELAAAGRPVDPVTADGVERLLAAVCAAFEVTPVAPDGSGLNELARVNLLQSFIDWEGTQKKSILFWPILPSAGEESPPSSPPSAAP